MAEKLTNCDNITPQKLTDKVSTSFKISLEEKLQNNYDFKTLRNKKDMESFQKLLYKLIGKSWDNIKSLKRQNCKNDKHTDGSQIIHFGEDGNTLRLHGIMRKDYFVLLRIDPKHKINKK